VLECLSRNDIGATLFGSAAEDKNEREEESIYLLEEGFLPV
jgi:hypothetical protein